MSFKHEARTALLGDDLSDDIEAHSTPNTAHSRAVSMSKSQYNTKPSAFIFTLIGLGVCVIFLFFFLALPMFAPKSYVYCAGKMKHTDWEKQPDVDCVSLPDDESASEDHDHVSNNHDEHEGMSHGHDEGKSQDHDQGMSHDNKNQDKDAGKSSITTTVSHGSNA